MHQSTKSESTRLRAHAQDLRLLSQAMSLREDREFFAKLADDYERRAERLDVEQTQQMGTQPPPSLPSDHAQPAQQQQQTQPKEEK